MTRVLKKYGDDDGRVICNMDVEGKRWHDRCVHFESNQVPKDFHSTQNDLLTKSEARHYTLSAILAGLVVVLAFSVTWVLFVLFLTQVVFR